MLNLRKFLVLVLSFFSFRKAPIRLFLVGFLTAGIILTQGWLTTPAIAQPTGDYCQASEAEIQTKNDLREKALQGDRDGQKRYDSLLKEQANAMKQCRSRSWLKDQTIWIRLYPCDARPGKLEAVFDKMVDRGYNKVYVEVFYNGQVLLPLKDNPTPWSSVLQTPGSEDVDLFAKAIKLGRDRGLGVYAWVYTMNFGYTYAQRAESQGALALNGKGLNSLSVEENASQVFIDPYNRQARSDYNRLLQEIVRRKPDGVLFDYVRYPRGNGAQSVLSGVKDLWIYGDSARQALFLRAQNNKGRVLIERYLSRGSITSGDVAEVDRLYPNEGNPLWQGRNPSAGERQASLQARQQRLQFDLWNLSVAHAAQGILDFLSLANSTVERGGIPAGAVFFADSNKPVGTMGFDSRLQPWDRFSPSLEWHPMAYGVCGENNTSCIVELVQRVTASAPSQTKVIPAIAGSWGRPHTGRPSLEAQMQAIHRADRRISSISHFAYSWQEPESDNRRKFCN